VFTILARADQGGRDDGAFRLDDVD
jgi:hypothetical protein